MVGRMMDMSLMNPTGLTWSLRKSKITGDPRLSPKRLRGTIGKALNVNVINLIPKINIS